MKLAFLSVYQKVFLLLLFCAAKISRKFAMNLSLDSAHCIEKGQTRGRSGQNKIHSATGPTALDFGGALSALSHNYVKGH
jgi:hypothetical protein